MSLESACEMAARYQFEAIEFKDTSHRADGVFLPKEPGLPLYFVEAQFYPLASVYADLLVKAYTYLKQNDPAQEFIGVVLFADRSLEPKAIKPYRALLGAAMIRPLFLNEMPDLSSAPLGLSILYLIREGEATAPPRARDLVARAKAEVGDESLRDDLIELIETVVMYKLPRLKREEIEAMLQIHDIRESRVYQEAKEEGREEGREEAIRGMAAHNFTAEQIAAILKIDLSRVKAVLAAARN